MSDEQPVESTEPVDSQQPVESAPEVASEQSAPEQPQSPNYWDTFKNLPDYQGQDDEQVARNIYQALQRERAATRALSQYSQVLPHANEYLQNKPQYEAWLKSREEEQAKANEPPPPQKFWNPPEVKENYRRYLIRDENGREMIDPNAPIEARNALMERQAYTEDFARKFLDNPEEALGPMVEQYAERKAQEIIESRLAEQEKQSYVQQVEQENSDWLFDSETGDATPAGLLVHKYIEEAVQLGLQTPEERWNYAVSKTERDVALQRIEELEQLIQSSRQPQQEAPPTQAQPPQQPPRDTAREQMEYLRREASRRPSRSAGTAANDVRVPRQKKSFTEMLQDDASSRGLI